MSRPKASDIAKPAKRQRATARTIRRQPQSQQQNHEHSQNRHGCIEARILPEAGEFIIIDRDEPGLPHSGLVMAVETQILRALFYRIRSCAAGFERAVVEHRLDGDEAAQFVRLRRLAAGESAPRKAGGPPVQHRRSRVGCQDHRPGQVVELQHSCLHRHQAKR
jgi:hypothetical protein